MVKGFIKKQWRNVTGILERLIYFFKRLWYGECPDCRVLLKPVEGWGRSDCPKCGNHFKDW